MKGRRRAASAAALSALAALCALLAALDPPVHAGRAVGRLLLVIDVTQSMNVRDAGGGEFSRLDFARRAASEALGTLPCGSEMGLGMFSGHRSFVLYEPVEICAHLDELRQSIAALDWRAAWIMRSEVSKGLFKAIEVTDQIGEHTALVFVSDGHEAPPLHERLRPRPRSDAPAVPGVIIGVGGERLVPIPKFDPLGRAQGVWRASEVMQVDSYRHAQASGESLVGVGGGDIAQLVAAGREHLSSLKADHLRTLAAQLDLRYHRADSAAQFRAALADPVLWRREVGPRSIARWFGAAALLLLALRAALALWPRS